MAIKYINIDHLALRTKKFDDVEPFYLNELGLKRSFELRLKDGTMPPYSYPKLEEGPIWLYYQRLPSRQFIEFFKEGGMPSNKPYVCDNGVADRSYFCASAMEPSEENICTGKMFQIDAVDGEGNGYNLDGGFQKIRSLIFACKHYSQTKDYYQNSINMTLAATHKFNAVLLDLFKNMGYRELNAVEGDEFCSVFDVNEDEHIILLNVPYNGVNEPEDQGFTHTCVLVEDIVQTARHLEAGNVKTTRGPSFLGFELPNPYPEDPIAAGMQGQCGSLAIYVQDPEGNDIELMQYTEDSLQTKY